MIAPLAYAKSNEIIEVLEETDPVSFLQLIYDADSIITDSYHGTILSINLEKIFIQFVVETYQTSEKQIL